MYVEKNYIDMDKEFMYVLSIYLMKCFFDLDNK